jgi:hypothetical protein
VGCLEMQTTGTSCFRFLKFLKCSIIDLLLTRMSNYCFYYVVSCKGHTQLRRIKHILEESATAGQCFQQLLSTLMSLIVGGEKSTVALSGEFHGFFRNSSHLIFDHGLSLLSQVLLLLLLHTTETKKKRSCSSYTVLVLAS